MSDEKILPTRTNAIAVRPESIRTPEGKTELRGLRTDRSKTHLHAERSPDGKEIRTCEVRIGAVCYRDDNGELRSIDTTIRDLGDSVIGVEWAPYKMHLHATGIGFDFWSRDGGQCSIKMIGIGGEKFDDESASKPDITDNVITFRDVRPGCDIVFRCLNDRIKTLEILRDADAPKTFEWVCEHDADGRKNIVDTLIGTDATGNQLVLSSELIQADETSMRWVDSWDGTATDLDGGPVDAVYPVEIDPTVTVNPGVNADDGREKVSLGWNPNSIIMGSSLGDGFNPGLRLPNVTVAQGTTITLATLDMVAKTINGAGGAGTIYGWAADNPVAFGTDLPSTVPKTSASVSTGTVSTTGAKSFIVTPIVQELLDRGGFASGNAMSIPIIGNVSSSDYTIFYDTADGSNYPSLSITYGATGNPSAKLLLGCG